MNESLNWIRIEKYKITIFVIVAYIPLWIIVSGLWQKDGEHVNLNEFLIIQGIVVIILILLIYMIYKYSIRSLGGDKFYKKSNPLVEFIGAMRIMISDFITGQNHKDEMFVKNLGWVKKCCNQTARLGESYCVCGRAVTKGLQEKYSF